MEYKTPFVPGHKIQPTSEQLRRGHSIQAAMREALAPDVAVRLFWEVWEIALQRRSPKALAEVLELGLSYAYGKPTQSIEIETSNMDLLAIALQSTGPLLPARERDIHVIDAPRIGQDEDAIGQSITYEKYSSHNESACVPDESAQSTADSPFSAA